MFHWDPRKAGANARKHGVEFVEAATVFSDPEALDGPDLKHSTSEPRRLRLGRSDAGRVLMVAYTFRGSRAACTVGKVGAKAAKFRRAARPRQVMRRGPSDAQVGLG